MRQVQVNPVHWSLQLDADLIAWKQLDTTFLCYDPYGRTSTQITSPTVRIFSEISKLCIALRNKFYIVLLGTPPSNSVESVSLHSSH